MTDQPTPCAHVWAPITVAEEVQPIGYVCELCDLRIDAPQAPQETDASTP